MKKRELTFAAIMLVLILIPSIRSAAQGPLPAKPKSQAPASAASMPGYTTIGDYADLAAAVAAIGARETILYINASTAVPVTLTVPANITLVVQRPGRIAVAGGRTLTINGPFDAGPHQVFSGSGTVAGLREARPEWWYSGSGSHAPSVASAFAASRSVRFSNATYDFGNTSAGAAMVSIDGGGEAVAILTDGLPKFTCHSSAGSMGDFFRITNVKGLTIGAMYFEDSGFVQETTGARGITLVAGDGKPTKGVKIDLLYGKNVTAPLLVGGTTTTRISGVDVGVIIAMNCTYGFNASNNGDNVNIGALYTHGVNRSYYVYGVTNHRANIYSDSSVAASSDILIAAGQLKGGYDTSGIDLKYTSRNTANATALVSLIIMGEDSHRIENVSLDLDIITTTAAKKVIFRAYNASGSTENTGTTNNVWHNISIKGNIRGGAGETAIMMCRPLSAGHASIDPHVGGYIAPSMFAHFLLSGPSGVFTPVVVGTATAGTGTYKTQTGRYTLVNGNRVFFEIALVWTNHTGTGNIQIGGLPKPSNAGSPHAPLSVVYSNLSIAAGRQLGAAVNPSASTVSVYQMDPGGGAVAQVPMQAAGSINISGHYER